MSLGREAKDLDVLICNLNVCSLGPIPCYNSNQGGIKSALTGKAASNVKGKIDKMLEKVGMPSMCDV